jgi:hypothetical protein
MAKPKDVDAYIAAAPDQARPILEELRTIVLTTIPNVEEKISWGVPFYRYQGEIGVFAAYAKHVSVGFSPVASSEHDGEVLALPDRLPAIVTSSTPRTVWSAVSNRSSPRRRSARAPVPANELRWSGRASATTARLIARRRLVSGQQEDRQQRPVGERCPSASAAASVVMRSSLGSARRYGELAVVRAICSHVAPIPGRRRRRVEDSPQGGRRRGTHGHRSRAPR